ncbi:MAG: DNA polymerase III subunit epsilon [Lautropia sp.]|nr:DNA polymerase III subunit epsilon [Lautropia sp.]
MSGAVRQISLDTETTGLEASQGHRIIEIGCVEMVNRRLTHNNLHLYINPEREVDEGAARVHGMTWDSLRDKPVFADVVDRFLDFCRGAEIIIHNAAFDVGFLNAELARLDRGSFDTHVLGITDTLMMAREQYPGKRNNLDALCERLMVPNKHRTLHGALLDAELLAEVYLGLTRGQGSFDISASSGGGEHAGGGAEALAGEWPPKGLKIRLAEETEVALHRQGLAALEKQFRASMLWHRHRGGAS